MHCGERPELALGSPIIILRPRRATMEAAAIISNVENMIQCLTFCCVFYWGQYLCILLFSPFMHFHELPADGRAGLKEAQVSHPKQGRGKSWE